MKTVTKVIKRKVVIEALRKEPLVTGCFWENLGHKATNGVKAGCNVCAVGAVLRRASFEKEFLGRDQGEIGLAATLDRCQDEDISKLLKNKNYLGALSCYFEDLIPVFNSVKNKDREKCIKFVKKNFPKQFKLTIKA